MNRDNDNRKNLSFIYTLHQCLYWTVICCIVSFAATYLTEKGFAVSTVGIVLFSANMLSFVVQLFLAGIADRAGNSRALKTLMAVLSGVALAIMLVMALADLPLWLMALLYVPMVAGFDMEIPLMNSVVVFYQKRSYAVSYSIARSVGAAAFGLSSLGMGYAIKGLGSNVMLITAIAAATVFIAVTFLYPEEGRLASISHVADGDPAYLESEACGDPARKSSSPISSGIEGAQSESLSIGRFILKYKWYVISVSGILFFGAAHIATENYMIEVVRPLGGDSSTVGIALMVSTFIEIPGTLVATWVYNRLRAHKTWMVIGASYTVRMLIYVLAGSIGMVLFGQALQLCSYALMPPSQLLYARDCVDDRDMVKGQSTSTAIYSLGNALGNLFGGLAVSAAGVSMMLKGCVGTAFIGFLIVAIFVPLALKAKNK